MPCSERRSAFLKEWGRVKVLVLVASARGREERASVPAIAVRSGLSGNAPGLVDLGLGRLGCQAFLRCRHAQHGAFRPRLFGLKQIVDLATSCGGHADFERAQSRVRGCSRCLGQATDLAVAQAVVDEREDFASDRDGGLVLAAALGDLVVVGREFAATVITDGAFDDRPAH